MPNQRGLFNYEFGTFSKWIRALFWKKKTEIWVNRWGDIDIKYLVQEDQSIVPVDSYLTSYYCTMSSQP